MDWENKERNPASVTAGLQAETVMGNSQPGSLSLLLDELMSESFAIAQHFEQTPMEKIGELLESESEKYEFSGSEMEPLSFEFLSLRESYERCKNIYCAILLELEKVSTENLAAQTPDELRQRTFEPIAEESIPKLDIPSLSHFELPQEIQQPQYEFESIQTFKSQSTRDFLKLAAFFENKEHSTPFPATEEQAQRLVGYSLCSALEAESLSRLMPAFKKFWPDRENAIRNLLDSENKKFQLNTQLKAAVDVLVVQHRDWLLDERFPHSGILTSFRYLIATPDAEKFQASFLDMMILLFFFGQDNPFEGLTVPNYLQCNGLPQLEMAELCFRLSRVYKIRNKLLTLQSDFSTPHLDQLKTDVERILFLMAKLEFLSDGNALQEVA